MSARPVLILDYGSQYTQLIARRMRELGFFSQVISGRSDLSRVQSFEPLAVILSGGPNSVFADHAPKIPKGFLDWQKTTQIPVLGICYGLQLLVHEMGGVVEEATAREYGRMPILVEKGSVLLAGLGKGSHPQVWMSHGDEAKTPPPGFLRTAVSESGSFAAMENHERKIYALQFHPEVAHTESGGEILRRFLIDIGGLKSNWSMGSVADEQVERIRKLVPEGKHAICGLSGGVDSTVAAVLVSQAIGDRLHCVFVDHGLLRLNEREKVLQMFEGRLGLKVTCVDARERFLNKLAGVSDPEKKRKIIGAEFISVFNDFAKADKNPEFLVQGTLYPDVIESSGSESVGGGLSATIKTHHNVGGLPKDLPFQLIEPLRDLFKDEVRALGKILNIPEDFLMRHPFPGPGLAVRILGDITAERIEVLQKVDDIFIEALKEEKLYSQIWQAFAVFLPVKSVGVQGDGRTHDHVVALRAVTSTDGMTADWFEFPPGFLRRVSSKICNQVRGVNRVVYDISSKPPATIEWE